MKRFKELAMASCLGLALSVLPAVAQQEPEQKPKDQPEQTQAAQPADPSKAQSQPDAAAQQGELPRTASPMPLVGLAGLLSLGAAGVLRATRK